MRGHRCFVLALGVAAVCAGAASADAPAQAPPAASLPTPYSAEQIRDAWQPGLRVEMRTQTSGDPSDARMTVLSATLETCTIRSEQLDSSGAAREPSRDFTSTWAELRDHALFEAATAARERAECRSQLGAMPGWRYRRTEPNGDVLTMCFADATPGPPVEYELRRGAELLSRTEHTRYERPAAGEERQP